MWWTVLAACSTPELEPKETLQVEVPVVAAEVVPRVIDFGVVGLGAPEVRPITVYNLGDVDLVLGGVRATSESVSVQAPLNPTILPGETAEVQVTWAPKLPEELDAEVELLVSGGGLLEYAVAVTGSAAGPVATLSTSSLDFGEVNVGCSVRDALSISNTGLGALSISSVSLDQEDSLSLVVGGGSEGPWTLNTFESLDVELTYTPDQDRDLTTTLRLVSDDPVSPELTVDLTGKGRILAENTDTFTVPGLINVTALFVLNSVVANGPYTEVFYVAMSELFATLQDLGVQYRAAFIVTASGELRGSVSYVDETMTTSETQTVIGGMLENPDADLDTQFQALSNGLALHRSWLIDEGNEWATAQLNLIGMNNDIEQSGGNYVTFLNEYRTYKTYPEEVVFHGVGGEPPRGCGGSDPAEAFYDAAAETGGMFISICEEDWAIYMESLALSMLGGDPRFVLSQEPAAWTITVYVDNREQSTGWVYEPSTREIVFDDTEAPLPGSELRIDYVLAVECPDVP